MSGHTDHHQVLIRTSAATQDSSLLEWTTWVTDQLGHKPALHHQLLLRTLSAIGRGTIDRLMVLMPPGSAKSTLAHVNTNLWGAYVSTPAAAGTWYAWVEGTDSGDPTVYPTPFTVT
jgi:hypothetical protein